MAQSNHPVAPLAVDLEHLRLLVVEAEPDTQAAIVSALRSCGAEVTVADSVQAGLVAVCQQYPDVIISDLHLPDGGGCALMQDIKRWEEADQVKPVPAIAVSDSARAVDLDEVLAAGFKRYIGKPIHPSRLVDMVARLAG